MTTVVKPNEFLGKVEVSPEAIELIVAIATSKVKEVHAIQGTMDIFSKSFLTKGVVLMKNNQGSFDVDLYVSLKYGSNVPKVAKQIQNRVKEQVYFMCNIDIAQVNVHVTQLVAELGDTIE